MVREPTIGRTAGRRYTVPRCTTEGLPSRLRVPGQKSVRHLLSSPVAASARPGRRPHKVVTKSASCAAVRTSTMGMTSR
jgi:hypothetical protein